MVGGRFVRVDVRAGEDGVVVACSDTRAHSLERYCLPEGDIGLQTFGQRETVWSGVRSGEWGGCFSVMDVKTIVHAVRECVAEQRMLGLWDW